MGRLDLLDPIRDEDIFPTNPPQPTEGQIDIDGHELRRPSVHEQPYACCDQALVKKGAGCVCFFISRCPKHGVRHNGTHD